MGAFIGGGREKSGNIALLVVLAGGLVVIAGLIALMTIPDSTTRSAIGTVVASALSLISGALGFVFGGGGKKE